MEACTGTQSSQDLPAAWQHDKALGDCMIKLYENKLWTDVKFKCKDHGDYERIHAHKIVLAARSPVFQAMFFGQCTEEKEDILLDSIEAETFDLFLRYTYMDKVTLTEDLAASVLETAHYYQVTNLVQLCADFLASCVRHDNVCGILSLAQRYEVSSLCKVCCIFIDENADEVMESEGFLELSENVLSFILKGDTFYADETNIFKKAEEWAEKKLKESQIENNGQNMRKILGPTFYNLRLPSMSLDEFLKCTRRKGYFSMEEYEDIVDFINRTPDTTVNSNSCISRLPNVETIYCSDEQNTEVASDTMQTSFYVTIHRDVKLKAVELAEIFPFLEYDNILYSNINNRSVYFNSSDSVQYALSQYTNQVIELVSSHRLCKLEKQIGQDLPEGVEIIITGSLKLSCKKEKIETVAVDDDDVDNGNNDEDDDSGNDDDDGKIYQVFQQDLRLASMDKAERKITLEQPVILEKSRSPYIFTLDLKNEYSRSVKMKTGLSSEKTFTSYYDVFEVEDIEGEFRGVRSLCFENISNRDEC
ncbi:BTB/POZ domain-containing protein 1-like [Ruditapes philippinarum]|uniref:BTB/POZ domain-containing protein 1-like n=1 Tax=Ruditapes philippinarum TaxID=129788 RepID=UPI00295AC423|nr:BTB/POZ domain-containing protein 1-like [Ruditapes philippinarum]